MTDAEYLRLAEKAEEAQKIEDAVKVIVNALNYSGSKGEVVDAMLNGINRSHRTLQQAFFGSLSQVMKKYGAQENFDDRNQASVKWCAEVSEKVPGYFPFI